MPQRLTLSDKLARTQPTGPSKKIYFDSKSIGLGLCVYPSGVRSWVYLYTFHGLQRKITIGPVDAWPITVVREHVRGLRRKIDSDIDPMQEREEDRLAPSVRELVEEFTKRHLPKTRPQTQKLYSLIFERIIIPAIGKKKIHDVTREDIQQLHDRHAARVPILANRAIKAAHALFASAKLSSNPAEGIRLEPEVSRERFLSEEEISRLGLALDNSGYGNAIRLVMFTGARIGETLAAKWKDFDLVKGVWSKPASTTKTAKLHRVPLSAPAALLLQDIKATAVNEWVFVDANGRPIRRINAYWDKIRLTAGIRDVRVHDLRHTYASLLASSGLSLPIIGKLLGHSQSRTTERYAHLADSSLRAATELVGAIVSGNVVELKRRNG